MCDPVTLGLILTAAGGATKGINTAVSLRRQDKAAARGIQEQGELQRTADKSINEQIADIAGSTGETERAEALEGFLNTLRGSQELTGAEVDPLGLGGGRFAERVGAGETRTRAAGTARAGRLSVVDAAGRQRVGEAGRVAATATGLDEVQRQSQARDFITKLRIASKRPNPLVNALGSALQGAGSIVALGAGGAPKLDKLFAKGTLIDPALTGTPILPQLGAAPPTVFA